MTREFGATAWGHAWLKQIEPVLITGPPDRELPRARALARRAIDHLTIDGPHLTARITDGGHQHTVTLNIPTWDCEEQKMATQIIGQSETSCGGDLSDSLVTELTSAGVPVAPRIEDITAISDIGEARRRHVLAVCYALVQRIDEEPALAVQLRTRSDTARFGEGGAPVNLLPLADINPDTFYDAQAGL